jgi:hypothetical protein
MITARSSLLVTCSICTLMSLGCNDEERDKPHASHPNPKGGPSEPLAQPIAPHKTEQQAKVVGAPPNTATAAPAGEPAGAAPSKTRENNKVSGSPSDGATAVPDDEAVVAPGKTSPTGKDATP